MKASLNTSIDTYLKECLESRLKMTQSSPFRSACFVTTTHTNDSGGISKTADVMNATSNILDYIQSYNQEHNIMMDMKIYSDQIEDNAFFANHNEEDDDEVIVIDDTPSSRHKKTKVNKDEKKQSIDSGNDDKINPISKEMEHAEMDGAIAMLEPHLVSFRQLCGEESSDFYYDENDSKKDELISNIPQSLIRVARFSPFKWIPLKKALLRTPMATEVGLQYRVALAKALYSKGILAGPEIHSLEEAYQSQEHGFNNKKNPRKRRRENNEMFNSLKSTFVRMSIDLASNTTAKVTIKHLQGILDEYCNLLDLNRGNKVLPSPSQVASWAMLSFNAVVVSNGFENLQRDSEQFHNEAQFVKALMTPTQSTSPKIIVDAIFERLRELLKLETLTVASNVNILCIVRFLSCISKDDVLDLFEYAVKTSFQSKYRVDGVHNLSKVFATFVSITRQAEKSFHFELFESKLRTRLQDAQGLKQMKFLDLILATTKFLLMKD